MDNLTAIGTASGSGLFGIILGWLRFKARIKSVEKSLKELQGAVRYEVTCKEITHAIEIQLNDIKKMNSEMRDDIKELLKK